jgi:hypothetical protein
MQSCGSCAARRASSLVSQEMLLALHTYFVIENRDQGLTSGGRWNVPLTISVTRCARRDTEVVDYWTTQIVQRDSCA